MAINRENVFLIISAALILGPLAYFGAQDFDSSKRQAEPWLNPVATPREIAALEWVKRNTALRTVFASDIFGGEIIMGLSQREGTEGGDWAIVPNVVQRMSDAHKLYETQSAQEAYAIAKAYNASYVWVPDRSIFAGFSWILPQREKFRDANYFELAYQDGGVEIWKVK
ncbi:MAG TPA: hypothetical protein VGQ00_04280 [Candidatus Norongarragalinales archaeon]|jgi:hypothetical protein|nr:hypothetical protein [Candidatus Norongarragalinales archaeon]